MQCRYCGAEMPDEAMFCGKCGRKKELPAQPAGEEKPWLVFPEEKPEGLTQPESPEGHEEPRTGQIGEEPRTEQEAGEPKPQQGEEPLDPCAFEPEEEEAETSPVKKWWFWVIIGAAVLLTVAGAILLNQNAQQNAAEAFNDGLDPAGAIVITPGQTEPKQAVSTPAAPTPLSAALITAAPIPTNQATPVPTAVLTATPVATEHPTPTQTVLKTPDSTPSPSPSATPFAPDITPNAEYVLNVGFLLGQWQNQSSMYIFYEDEVVVTHREKTDLGGSFTESDGAKTYSGNGAYSILSPISLRCTLVYTVSLYRLATEELVSSENGTETLDIGVRIISHNQIELIFADGSTMGLYRQQQR